MAHEIELMRLAQSYAAQNRRLTRRELNEILRRRGL